jgi:hypothetical protein
MVAVACAHAEWLARRRIKVNAAPMVHLPSLVAMETPFRTPRRQPLRAVARTSRQSSQTLLTLRRGQQHVNCQELFSATDREQQIQSGPYNFVSISEALVIVVSHSEQSNERVFF